jgi:N-acylglucosamine 2-epimerase
MILCNLTQELEHLLEPNEVESTIDWCLDEILNHFLDRERNLLYENVLKNGQKINNLDGRLINPGHGIETAWFLLQVSRRRNDPILRDQAVSCLLNLIEFGWDTEYGGIFYFLDSDGHPTQQLEWDQKLWWVHLEALVGLLMAYNDTGNEKYWLWFERIHSYSWSQFPDLKYGEWFGYLNRTGAVLLTLKGGKWKGCFHLPRALLRCYQELCSIKPD